MRRRTLLATIATGLGAGCTSIAEDGAGPSSANSADRIDVLDWADATTESMDVEYGAVRIDARDVEEPPMRIDFGGLFDTGTETMAVRPSDAENYGAHGADLYSAEEPHGWLIFHPDAEEARLIKLGHAPSETTWARS